MSDQPEGDTTDGYPYTQLAQDEAVMDAVETLYAAGIRTAEQYDALVQANGEAPALEDDRTAMMLGLVADKRTPSERLLDAVRTNGESLSYRYEPLGDSNGGTADGRPCAQ